MKNEKNIFALLKKDIILKRRFEDSPKDFFYGVNLLDNFSIHENIINSNFNYKYSIIEKVKNFRKYKFSNQKAEVIFSKLKTNDTLIVFNDYESFNLGYFNTHKVNLVCGFQRAYETIKNFKFEKRFEKSLKKIDKIFFFGEEDKFRTEKLFPFIKSKSYQFSFGVDTDYWKNTLKFNPKIKFDICCIGSDTYRDYEIIKTIDANIKIKLITKLDIKNLPKNVIYEKSSYGSLKLSDDDIKNVYLSSKIVLVPLHNTIQPSGQSVTMQAMSLGRAVILAKIDGLWDRSFFKENENILFYRPGDLEDLKIKINSLLNDKSLRKKIEKNARITAIKYFHLKRMKKSLINILDS